MSREEIVGALEIALRDGTVLVGHEISERTAVGVAERLAAVHAAGGLLFQVLVRKRAFNLFPVVLALFHRAVDVMYSLHITNVLAHAVPTVFSRCQGGRIYGFCKTAPRPLTKNFYRKSDALLINHLLIPRQVQHPRHSDEEGLLATHCRKF